MKKDYTVILSANDTVYRLQNLDDILTIDINYNKFVAIDIEFEEDGAIKHFPILFKSPFDDKYSFVDRVHLYGIDDILSEFLSITYFLNKDYRMTMEGNENEKQ